MPDDLFATPFPGLKALALALQDVECVTGAGRPRPARRKGPRALFLGLTRSHGGRCQPAEALGFWPVLPGRGGQRNAGLGLPRGASWAVWA